MIDVRLAQKTDEHHTFAVRETVNREQRRADEDEKEALYVVTIAKDGSAAFGNITGHMTVENVEHFLQSVLVCKKIAKDNANESKTETSN